MHFSNIVKYQKFPTYPSLFLFSRSKSYEPYDPPFSYIPKAPTISPKQPQNPNPLTRKSPSGSSLPFDFQYSYSESDPKVKPIGFREPTRFSPFGPGRLDRKWNGISAKFEGEVEESRELWLKEREEVLGESLIEEEVDELVEKYRHSDCSRQINLGNRGVTHNLLDDIHNHWKRAEAVRIKCLGVPTLDMDNVCSHLEDKTGGKIIHRKINILLLYRGRNYDSKQRPVIPLMLWKPLAPIYPKLVKNVADGLTFEEQKELRNTGLNSPALMKLRFGALHSYII